MRYHVGDELEFLDNTMSSFTKGQLYTVVRVDKGITDWYCVYFISNDDDEWGFAFNVADIAFKSTELDFEVL